MVNTVSTSGTIGTDLDVYPAPGSQKRLKGMVVVADGANDGALIRIYNDSAVEANKIHESNYHNRDADNAVYIDAPSNATSKWIVQIVGGSGSFYVKALYV